LTLKLEMAISNVLLLSQLTANIVVCILSLCILIPMIVNKRDFRGHCLLFSTGTWREEDGQFEVSWASQGLCNYILFVGASLLIASITQIYRLSTHLYKGQDSTFLEAFVDTVISSFLCIIAVIACLIVTLGFDTWCRSITKRFEACEDATDNDIDEKDKIDTTGFYMHMGTAQFGVWASWACCVGTSVFAILKLCRYHQQENMRLSMAKAREHLLQKALSENGDANSSRSTINADDLNSRCVKTEALVAHSI